MTAGNTADNVIATTDSPKARAVPTTVEAKSGLADVHDKLTAVPHPDKNENHRSQHFSNVLFHVS